MTLRSTGLSIALNKSVASKRTTFVSVTSGGSGSLGEAHVDTPFMKKVLYITKRKWKTNIQHDCKSDDFRAGFEVAEWGVFCHSERLQSHPTRLKQFSLTVPFCVLSLMMKLSFCYEFVYRFL